MPRGGNLRTAVAREEGVADNPMRLLPMGSLKELVLSRFPEGHPLRDVILAEKDHLTTQEFLAKMEVWGVLLRWRA